MLLCIGGITIAPRLGQRRFDAFVKDVLSVDAASAQANGQPLKLLVVDSLSLAVGNTPGSLVYGTNINAIYSPLTEFARTFNVAVLIIGHTLALPNTSRSMVVKNQVRFAEASTAQLEIALLCNHAGPIVHADACECRTSLIPAAETQPCAVTMPHCSCLDLLERRTTTSTEISRS